MNRTKVLSAMYTLHNIFFIPPRVFVLHDLVFNYGIMLDLANCKNKIQE